MLSKTPETLTKPFDRTAVGTAGVGLSSKPYLKQD